MSPITLKDGTSRVHVSSELSTQHLGDLQMSLSQEAHRFILIVLSQLMELVLRFSGDSSDFPLGMASRLMAI